jgi:predicted ATPase/class 3 adenylate cyclase
MGDAVRPSGVVTFLFTDIEGSTRRWEADPDAMRDALAAHDDTLRSAIEAHDGWLFKHTGDGVCAAFVSPGQAVDAAIDAQRALELPVRMGIATGEAELRGEDYFGPALNRTARVMSAGHGGQILLVDTTATLVREVELVDMGPRRLRDLSEPVGIFEVQAEGLESGFPPLRTLDETPGNLKPQRNSFMGRETELAEVEAALRAHRLVTLTGVGGVGKTRLALQAAAELAPEFADGVFVIELASVGDPEAVDDAVAGVLGIVQQSGLSVAESVGAALEGRLRLLVLDNCEHVLDAAASLVEEIFARSATVRVLATSREGLRVDDEHVWTVPSLGLGESTDSEAVRLFVERAQAVVQDFSLERPEDASAAVEICRRLDGIPLAIELASSRMVSMAPVEVRDRLDDRFRLLSGSRRGLERHQTLRHAVQWSYDLLDEEEQVLLNRCSVFAGGFDLAAGVAIAGDGADEYAVLDLLDALVRKSLIVADRTSGRTRYSMLETIRQFAEDELATAGHSVEARTTHARYYADQEADVLALWRSPREREAYEWLDAELANLRIAFRWAADQGDLDTAATIATYSTNPLGFNRGQLEPSTWAEELIDAARAVDHRLLVNLYAAASFCCLSGRLEVGVAYGEAGLALIDDPHFDDLPYASDWVPLTHPYIYVGQPERWVQGLRVHIERGLPDEIFVRANLVVGLVLSGQLEESKTVAAGLIDDAEAAAAEPWAMCQVLIGHAYAVRDIDPAGALEAARRGAEVARDSGNRYMEGHLAMLAGQLEAEHGDPHDAFDLLRHAIVLENDAGNASVMNGPLLGLAFLLDRLGYYQPAATLIGFSMLTPSAELAFPMTATMVDHLSDTLGDDRYHEHARDGAAMTRAAIARYALNHIDQARATVDTP